MKRIYRLGLFLLLASAFAFAAPPSDGVSQKLIFLQSPDAGPLESQKLTTCVRLLVRELGLEGKDLPRIMVVHVSKNAGKAAGVPANRVRRNSAGDLSDVYYEFWIVGPSNAAAYAISLETVLESEFELKLTAAERDQVLARVVRALDATVSAKSFLDKN